MLTTGILIPGAISFVGTFTSADTATVGSVKTDCLEYGGAIGDQASTVMLLSWQYLMVSSSWEKTLYSIWLTAGLIVATFMISSSCAAFQLLTPMDFKLPFFTLSSRTFHVLT